VVLELENSEPWCEICLTISPNRREAKHQKLRMPRLPMMEIDAEASDVLSAHVAACVHQLKQFSISMPALLTR